MLPVFAGLLVNQLIVSLFVRRTSPCYCVWIKCYFCYSLLCAHLMTSILSHGFRKATVPVLERGLSQSWGGSTQTQWHGKVPLPAVPMGVPAQSVLQSLQPSTHKILRECTLHGHGGNSGHFWLTCLFSERKKKVLDYYYKEIKSPHGGFQKRT